MITTAEMHRVAEKLRSLLQQRGKWPRPRDLYDFKKSQAAGNARHRRIMQ